MNTPVFMYHALYYKKSELKGADEIYSISYDTFDEHIKLCELANRKVSSLSEFYSKSVSNRIPTCVFTFDDGHCSNYKAMLKLIEKGYTADLFVNTALINTENYMTDVQLKEVSDAGISVQSHGHEHPYFSELSEDEIHYQLSESKRVIENITNKTVNIFAPPGGRINHHVIRIAKELGYLYIANSRPGNIDKKTNTFNIPRLPIQAHTTNLHIEKWLKPSVEGIFVLQCKFKITKVAKHILGNQRYEKLRKKVLD